MRYRFLSIVALYCAAAGVQAQTQSMEERLRTQLRLTTEQLRAAQNELAVLKDRQPASSAAAGPESASSAEVAALKKDLAQARAQLDSERRARPRLDASNQQLQQQAEAVVTKANAQIAQFRNAYDELLKMARASESERQRLAAEVPLQKAALQQCEAKNKQLYTLGQEVVHAYETVNFGSVLASRQPFAAKARVKYEEVAQKYGDQLYQGRFDSREPK